MEEAQAKEVAIKQRIITHMNADHQDSLVRYLEHFCSLSSSAARNAKLDDISLKSLTVLSTNGSAHIIPINPAMTSISEARGRVVAMDAEAINGLQRSDITVKRYVRPHGWTAVVFLSAAFGFLWFSRRSNFLPGSLLYDNLLRHTPWFAQLCYTFQPLAIITMDILHGSEATYMATSRLRKHTVPTFSRLWWTWVASTFIEGVGAFTRFDELVTEETKKKEKVKH